MNEEILRNGMVQEDRKILSTIWFGKHRLEGHMLRHVGMQRDILKARRKLGKRIRVAEELLYRS